MGSFDSSTISISNLEPTTSTLSGNVVPATTTLGGTTTTGTLWVVDKDEDGEMRVNPKKLAGLVGTITTTTSTSLNVNSAMAAENKAQAIEMGITEEQEEAVNQTRNIEEWFESLSNEEQENFLAMIDQKEQEIKNIEHNEEITIKHL